MLGSGILKGLAVTAKNFIGSYHDPARMVTEQYPEERPKLPEAYRNFPFLVTENATDPMGTLRCVACQICEKECPPQCIYIEKSKDKKPDAVGKMQIYPTVFAIDTSVCMSCQLCVEVCPFDAIKMDHVFEVATNDRFSALLLNREQLAKPNTYFHAIRPTEATEVDDRLAAERKAAEEKARAAAAAKAAAAAPKPAAPGASPRRARIMIVGPLATLSSQLSTSVAAADTAFLERAPLVLRNSIVQLFPESLQWLVHHLLTISVVLTVFGFFFAFTTIAERKLLARLQNRLGPNRAGLPFFRRLTLWGLTQPFADAVKAFTKEDVVPDAADKVLHFLAPVVVVAFSLLGFAVLPFGRNLIPVELDAALLYFFAAGAGTELAIFMAGWGSRNKYSLLAAMRALAQLISYELPLLLSVVPVVLVTGTLSTKAIAEAQGGWTFGVLPHWHVLTPWGFASFLIFLVAALAESNRSPFDLPEAESELVAGHLTEYSGFKYALFFMGEYFGLTALSGLGVTLFLGGWQAPCAFLEFIPSYLWFMGKLAGMIVLFIWIRGTLLRLRIDQLTRLSWKLLVPLALLNLANAAFWSLTAGWTGPLGLVRWVVSAAIIVVPFVLLGRRLGAGLGPRTYRYAQ